MTEDMEREEINTWTNGPWDCVCGETGIDGSFGCPSCKLTVIGSNMERRSRQTQSWVAFEKEVNAMIRDSKLQELMSLRDKIDVAIEELQMRGAE